MESCDSFERRGGTLCILRFFIFEEPHVEGAILCGGRNFIEGNTTSTYTRKILLVLYVTGNMSTMLVHNRRLHCWASWWVREAWRSNEGAAGLRWKSKTHYFCLWRYLTPTNHWYTYMLSLITWLRRWSSACSSNRLWSTENLSRLLQLIYSQHQELMKSMGSNSS